MIGPPVPACRWSDASQDQGAHDALAKVGLRDHQRAQTLWRDDESLDGFLRDSVRQCRPPGQLRKFTQEVALAMKNDRLTRAEIVVLADGDLAGKDNDETRRNLARSHEAFAGREGTHLTEAHQALDFIRIELREIFARAAVR